MPQPRATGVVLGSSNSAVVRGAACRNNPPWKVLAANQGLYNGFLAAGLVWGLVADNQPVKMFFLACVLVAGLFGAATASRKILFVQALPAAIALSLMLFRSAGT